MKLDDLILVMESIKGKEVNYLSTLDDYLKVIVAAYSNDSENLALAVVALLDTKKKAGGWSEIYFAANKSSHARFCYSEPQLRGFLLGNLNQKDTVERFTFDEDRCSSECLVLLEAYGLNIDGHTRIAPFRYNSLQHTFQAGEIIHNLNGKDYRILEVLSESNLLLMSMGTGEINVGIGTQYFEKVPKAIGVSDDYIVHGVEWSHGVYLGGKITKIDFDEISRMYGRPERIETVEDYRNSLKKIFFLYKKLRENEQASISVKEAVINSIYEEFGTAKEERFLEHLENGQYDSGYLGKESAISTLENEKSR